MPLPLHPWVHHHGVLMPLPLRRNEQEHPPCGQMQEETLPWALYKQVTSNPLPLHLTSLKILFNPHTQRSVAPRHRTNKKAPKKTNPISINFLWLLENHLCNFAAFPFNPTDRIMFICLKHCICCDYHKTSFSGRHGPLPIFNREPLSLQSVCAAADCNSCPAAQGKEAWLVHLGAGVLEPCPLSASSQRKLGWKFSF